MPDGSSMAGLYAFRFSGFNNNKPRIYYIVGLGSLEIDDNNEVVSGSQAFSKTLISDVGDPLKSIADGYDLTGVCKPGQAGGLGSATINFLTAGQVRFIGQYILQRIDSDRFWLISKSITGASPVKTYDEVTSIEVTRRS